MTVASEPSADQVMKACDPEAFGVRSGQGPLDSLWMGRSSPALTSHTQPGAPAAQSLQPGRRGESSVSVHNAAASSLRGLLPLPFPSLPVKDTVNFPATWAQTLSHLPHLRLPFGQLLNSGNITSHSDPLLFLPMRLPRSGGKKPLHGTKPRTNSIS